MVKDNFVYKIYKQTFFKKKYWMCKTGDCHAHIPTDLKNNFLSSSGEYKHLLESEDLRVKIFRHHHTLVLSVFIVYYM